MIIFQPSKVLLKDISNDDKKILIGMLEEIIITKDQFLFRKGDLINGLFIVIEGNAVSTSLDSKVTEFNDSDIIFEYNELDFFGEESLSNDSYISSDYIRPISDKLRLLYLNKEKYSIVF